MLSHKPYKPSYLYDSIISNFPGESHRSIAKKLEVSDHLIGKWKSNVSSPSLDVLDKVAQICNLPLDWWRDKPLEAVINKFNSQEVIIEDIPPAPLHKVKVEEAPFTQCQSAVLRRLAMLQKLLGEFAEETCTHPDFALQLQDVLDDAEDFFESAQSKLTDNSESSNAK